VARHERDRLRRDIEAGDQRRTRAANLPKKPRFGTLGDTVSCSSTFISGLQVVLDSWSFVEDLCVRQEPLSWSQLHEMFVRYDCRYAKAAFVCSHTLENLVLLNHKHRRVSITLASDDNVFMVGLGPNPVDFLRSYSNGTFTFEELAACIQRKRVTATATVDGTKMRYASPDHAITYTNVQDTVCMMKKHIDDFALNFLAEKNLYKPKVKVAPSAASGPPP